MKSVREPSSVFGNTMYTTPAHEMSQGVQFTYWKQECSLGSSARAQKLCESRGGPPVFPSLTVRTGGLCGRKATLKKKKKAGSTILDSCCLSPGPNKARGSWWGRGAGLGGGGRKGGGYCFGNKVK